MNFKVQILIEGEWMTFTWEELNETILFGNDLSTYQKRFFTGLRDKKGKEIYEGDIVNQEKWVSVGNYKRARGIVKYKMCEFVCECIGEWFGSNADLNWHAEVIGNIYENPELLTP